MAKLSSLSWVSLLVLSGCPNLDSLPFEAQPHPTRPPPIHSQPSSETGNSSQDSWQRQCQFSPISDNFQRFANLENEALKQALSAYIGSKKGLSYAIARDHMYRHHEGKKVPAGGPYTGIDVDASGEVTCVYTGLRFKADGSRTPPGNGSAINTEHTWPRSKGAEEYPAEGDLFHLFPTEQEANNRRSNYEFGNVKCGGANQPACRWQQGGSKLGPSSDSRGGLVFEVRREHRGDVARALFYFAIAYNRPINPEEEVVLREWNCQDPPDSKEKARNAAIERIVGIRNPFVEAPSLVYRISDY